MPATVAADAVLAAFGRHAALLQLLVHALLEPGQRRDWLLREQLPPLQQRARAWLGAGPSSPRERDAAMDQGALWMWIAAAAALPCLVPALPALDPSTAAQARVQRALLARAWPGGPAFPRAAEGPWSLAAAARRQLARAQSADRD